MTNLQLLLSIGIPALLIVLSSLNNNQRIDTLQKSLSQRIDAVQQTLHDRIDSLEKRMDGLYRRMDSFEKRLEDARRDSHKDALEIMRSMTALHERVAVVEAKQA